MYIRRKVFSVLADEMGEERLYSVNETLFEGFEVDELDERMYAQVVDGQLGSEYVVDKKGYANFWKDAVDKEGNITKKAPKAKKVQGEIVIDKNTGKAVLKMDPNSKSSKKLVSEIKKLQKQNLKNYEKELAAEQQAFKRSGVAEMKKALRAAAEKSGRSKATLRDAYRNAGKLGKAGMIAAPVVLAGGALAAGRASKRD